MRLQAASVSVLAVALLFVGGLPSGDAEARLALPGPASGLLHEPDWWEHWARDRDGDRIDDAIAALEAHGPAIGRTLSGVRVYSFEETPQGLRYNLFVRFDGAPDVAAAEAVAVVLQRQVQVFPLGEAVYARGVPAESIPAVLAVPGVVAVELERTVVPFLDIASDAMLVTFSAEIGNGARGRYKVSGRGAVLAVLDTGIDNEHEAFVAERFIGGFDATLPPLMSLAPHLRDLPATVPLSTPLNEVDPDDRSESTHGTHVASIAVGVDPNGTYMGMAPDAKFLDVKVLMHTPTDDDLGTSNMPLGIGSMVMSGLEFVAQYNRGASYLGDPGEDTVDVVVMSLGEKEPDEDGSSVVSMAVNNLVNTGVNVVVAAGNCGPGARPADCCADSPVEDDCNGGDVGNDTIPAPAAARHAITVASMDDRDTVLFDDDLPADTSSRGPNGGEPKPNLAAYGQRVTAAKGAAEGNATNEYHNLSGTSMAAPMVAGVIALMIEADPGIEPARVKELLMKTARDVQEDGWDKVSGAGVLNAYFAVGATLGFLDPDRTRINENGKDDNATPPPQEEPKPNITIANRPPRVAFKFAPTPAHVGESVVFVDESVDIERDVLVAWNWDFGDGDTGKGDRIAHQYDKAGTYKVRLTVTDVKGGAASSSADIEILPKPGEAKESPGAGIAALAAGLAALVAVSAARRRRDDA